MRIQGLSLLLLLNGVAAWGLGGGAAGSSVSSVAAAAASPVGSVASAAAASATDKIQTPYAGVEYKWKRLTFRPAQHRKEGVFALVALFYLLVSTAGKRINKARAKAWLDANSVVLKEEFAGVGMPGKKEFDSDGGDEYLTYATGRRGCDGAHVRVQTEAYHDLLALSYNLIRPLADVGWRSQANKVGITFALLPPQGTTGANKFVFAISKRTVLRALRDERWDVRTFTTTTESSGLDPSELIVQTESGEVTNSLCKDPKTGIADVLKQGATGFEWFESLVISDMPAITPDEYEPKLPENSWKMTIVMRLPPASRAGETKPLVGLACNLVDVLYSKTNLLPDVSINKLKKKRADKLDELLKPLKAEKAEEERDSQAAMLAKKRRLDQEKIDAKLAAMTPAQRLKHLEKEKEKERKKQMSKMSKRAR